MSILFLNNIKVNAPKPTDWKYRVETRFELVSILSVPTNYPYLGQLSVVVNDNYNNGLYLLTKEPDLSIANSGVILSDWMKIADNTIVKISTVPDPNLDIQHTGTFLYETDTSTLKIWNGTAWDTLISGSSASNFVEYDKFVNLPVVGAQNVLYIVLHNPDDSEANAMYRWDVVDTRYEAIGGSGGGGDSTTRDIIATIDAGGIKVGQTVPIGTDLEKFIELIIDPVYEPTMTAASLVVGGITAGYVEVGIQITGQLTTTFDRGLIDSKDAHSDIPLVGVKNSTTYIGGSISGTGAIAENALFGNNVWSAKVDYDAGTGVYYDSMGQPSTALDAFRVSGDITESSEVLTGIHPMFSGVSDLDYSDGSGIYGSLTKAIEPKSGTSFSFDIDIPAIAGGGKFIYVAYPDAYGSISSVRDGNEFDVTSSFAYTQKALVGHSPGVLYRIYKSISKTFVDTQEYEIIWQ